jgi:molybdopterin synthase catalytic subunit
MINFSILTYQPIDIPGILMSIRSPHSGGIVMFSGEVRNFNNNRKVEYIEYEAYETMAEKKIREIVDYAIGHWKLNNAHCIHRLGKVEISECAVLVVTASSHRAQAYEANSYIIDMVKTQVPVWKKEYYTDGTFEWGKESLTECSKEIDSISALS